MAKRNFLIKGSKCGRDKDGTFYCECGKCEELSSEKSPQDAEGKDLSAGYLSEKDKDDFIRYIIVRLERVEKWIKTIALVIAIDLVISVIQILL